MILYIENPIKDSMKKQTNKKLWNLINEFGKVTGYKINIQKSMVFLYYNNELSQRETENNLNYH